MQDKYLSVEALTKYLKFKFDNDTNLKSVFLKGEISNFKAHSTGHFYFSIKDEKSKINAIMFSSSTKKLVFRPVEGMKILVHGRISVYEQTGGYQIYVDEMLEDGVGNLYIAFEQLKEKLEKEGLFDQRLKKPIKEYPKKIGVITARTGAAVRDIITTIKRRYPICEIYLFPSLVQGDSAAGDIAFRIDQANKYDLDTLIIGRGGGSIEDLWPFNEEIVARAIHNSKIPIISGVGHEVDFTISDFVSDLRAPTPTAAAEIAVPNLVDVNKYINTLKLRINESMLKGVKYQKLYLDSIKNSFVLKTPNVMFENKVQQLDLINEKIHKEMSILVDKKREVLNNIKKTSTFRKPELILKDSKNKLHNIITSLELLNPITVLKRGYSLTYSNEEVVKSIKDVKKNDTIKVKLHDGHISANITEVIKGD